jgi:hypothetical protein
LPVLSTLLSKNERKIVSDEQLGYLFHGEEHPSALGPLELTVNLLARPTHQHFDPEEATFPVADLHSGIDQMEIVHPWHRKKTFQVCAGRIFLRDRLDKTVEAFSFGGDLTIEAGEKLTTCHLRSPAPIIALTAVQSLSVIFVSTVESLLARRRVAWECDDIGYEHRLASIAPDTLFAAALAAAARHLDHFPVEVRSEHYWHHAAALDTAIQRMKADGSWPSPTPSLDDLMACSGQAGG